MRVFASRRVVDIHDLNCFRRRRKRGEPKLIFFGFSIDFKSIPSTNPPLQEQVHTHSEWEWSSTKKKKSRFKGEPRSRKRWENGFFLLIHTTTTTTSCALAASVSIHTHQVSFLFLFKCQNSENWKNWCQRSEPPPPIRKSKTDIIVNWLTGFLTWKSTWINNQTGSEWKTIAVFVRPSELLIDNLIIFEYFPGHNGRHVWMINSPLKD